MPQSSGVIDTDAEPVAKGLTRFETVYQQLRADILACRLLPGARLQINTLAQEQEVSLGGVREALSRLSAEGLVIAEPQRGFKVAPVSLQDLTDLTQTRIEIESLCLTKSIARGGVEWETAVVAAAHRLSRTPYTAPGDGKRLGDQWVSAHHAFHEALVSACDSAWLIRIRRMLYQQGERYQRLSVPIVTAKRSVESEHKAIYEAALARKAPRACELMAEHLTLTMNIITKGLSLRKDGGNLT